MNRILLNDGNVVPFDQDAVLSHVKSMPSSFFKTLILKQLASFEGRELSTQHLAALRSHIYDYLVNSANTDIKSAVKLAELINIVDDVDLEEDGDLDTDDEIDLSGYDTSVNPVMTILMSQALKKPFNSHFGLTQPEFESVVRSLCACPRCTEWRQARDAERRAKNN